MPDEKQGEKNTIVSKETADRWYDRFQDNPYIVLGFLGLALIALCGWAAYANKGWAVWQTVVASIGFVFLVLFLVIRARRSKATSEPSGTLLSIYLVFATLMLLGVCIGLWAFGMRGGRMHDVEDAILGTMVLASWAGLIPVYWSRAVLGRVPRQITAVADRLGACDKAITDSLEAAKKELNEAKERLVSTVEDATRSQLRGFLAVFEKALWMMENAQEKLYFINFALNFGEPHLCNEKFKEAYRKTYSKGGQERSLETDVKAFFNKFKAKIVEVHDVQILTVDDDGCIKNFMKPLSEREGYKGNLNVEQQCFKAQEAKKTILRCLALNQGAVYAEARTLPIQLLIAGLPPEVGRQKGRVGCLVFMVGTEVLRSGLEPGMEPAFYTELEGMSEMFTRLALALIQSAKKTKEEDG